MEAHLTRTERFILSRWFWAAVFVCCIGVAYVVVGTAWAVYDTCRFAEMQEMGALAKQRYDRLPLDMLSPRRQIEVRMIRAALDDLLETPLWWHFLETMLGWGWFIYEVLRLPMEPERFYA